MSKENKRDRKQDPEEVAFLNANSLAFIDELFYHLPFPDIGQLGEIAAGFRNYCRHREVP